MKLRLPDQVPVDKITSVRWFPENGYLWYYNSQTGHDHLIAERSTYEEAKHFAWMAVLTKEVKHNSRVEWQRVGTFPTDFSNDPAALQAFQNRLLVGDLPSAQDFLLQARN